MKQRAAKASSARGANSRIGRSLDSIVQILKARTSHDFGRYKRSTLERRILRRMGLLEIASASRYVEQLRQDPAEADAMFRELLIGVTEFFRDPDAFHALEAQVIPRILEGKSPGDSVRVWVPGCSTGEEAYSIAVLITEQMTASGGAPAKLQIFGTDLDERSLTVARKGLYPEDEMAHLSVRRIRASFARRGRHYEVKESVRSTCVFSLHNLIKDPPFSKLDLISCRNVLIYLESDVQRKLLPLFHHSLNPGGFLFLGPSENLANRSELFEPVEKKHRIYRRNTGPEPKSPDLKLPDSGRITRPQIPPLPTAPGASGLTRSVERILLEEFAAPSVVIDARGDVLYFFGRIGSVLGPQSGSASHKLVQLVRKDYRLELRGAIHTCVTTRREVLRRGLSTGSGRQRNTIDLLVRPLHEAGRNVDLFIVVFQPVVFATSPRRLAPARDQAPVVAELQAELQAAKEELQAAIEELETSNEELKSANEELTSMNEELQSTNEELQTSKEELQSANDDLQRKHDELEAADNDLQNFFRSAELAAMFVDTALNLRRITPALARHMPGIEPEVGRPVLPVLRRVASGADWPPLIQEALEGRIQERRMPAPTGPGVIHIRLTPYRTSAGRIEGAVITCTDISQAVVAEREHEQLAAIVRHSTDAILAKDLNGTITAWNEAAERMFGYPAADAVGKPIFLINPPDRIDEERQILSHIRGGHLLKSFDTFRLRRDGQLLPVSLTISPIRNRDGEVIGASTIARDISERRNAGLLQQQLASIVASSHDAILSKDLSGTIRTWNDAASRIFGYTAEEAVGQPVNLILAPGHEAEEAGFLESVRKGDRIEQFETVRRRKDGSLVEVSLTISPIRDTTGAIIGASSIGRDITAYKKAEREIQQARDILAEANRNLEERIQERTAELTEANAQLETLVYSIAHDLRAPLRSMHAFSNLLIEEHGAKLDESGRNYAERIVRASGRMDRLVLDLLNYGRTARAEMDLAPVDLRRAWSEAQLQNEQLVRDTQAQIDDSRLVGTAFANEATLVQMLANLLNNGIKFTPAGTRPRVTTWSEAKGERIRVWIEDAGIGIPPQYQDRIFRVFERLNAAAYDGTGIGLSIVRKGAERMGGEAGVESTPGSGSRFWVELPLAPTR